MRFLLDESANFRIIPYLRRMGHNVATIAVAYPASLPDNEVLAIAAREDRILVTHDRHFGGLVFVDHQPHAGVILLRLGSRPPLDPIIARLTEVLSSHGHELDDFIVVTADRIRVRRSLISMPVTPHHPAHTSCYTPRSNSRRISGKGEPCLSRKSVSSPKD